MSLTSSGKTPLFKFLRRDSSQHDIAVDGSGASVKFFLESPAANPYTIVRLNFQMIDAKIEGDIFGGIAALTNGCKFYV